MKLPNDLVELDSCKNDNRDKFYIDCVRMVYKRRFQNLLTHFIAASIPVYLGWANKNNLTNIFLVSLLLVYTFTGYYVHFSSKPALAKGEQVIRLARPLYYQIAVLGILYNLIFLNLAINGVENAMIYLLLITALFSAGGVSSYQHLKWLGPLFVFSAMFPQSIYYLSIPGLDAKLMAFMIAVFIFFMSNVGLQLHKDAIETLSLNHKLREAKEKAEQLARTDVLTGLFNRRAFFEMGRMNLKNAQRYGHPLSLVMLDIDHFKKINDTYGHSAGDEVLKALANILSQQIRESDVSGRLGGEEFAIILQEANLMFAQELIGRLRKEVEQTCIHFEEREISVTASFGVAQLDAEGDSFETLLERADYAMYQAKKDGRNRVVVNKN
jgi:diguanylate cyclase